MEQNVDMARIQTKLETRREAGINRADSLRISTSRGSKGSRSLNASTQDKLLPNILGQLRRPG